jgi:inosose dehydratase
MRHNLSSARAGHVPPADSGRSVPAVSRRRFLQLSAAGAGATLLPWRLPVLAAEDANDPYGGFKMAIQSYSLRNFDVETALEHSRKLGLKYWEAYPRHIPLGTLPAHVAEQKAKLEQAGITLMAWGVVGFDANETKAREVFDFAHAMGLKSISADPQKNKETFDLLEKLVEEYEIPIAIHNHGPGHRYDKVEDVLEMVEGRHKLLGACVDTGHYLRSDEDPVEVIHKLGERVYGVHLKDVRTILSDEEKARLIEELPQNRARQLEREGKIFTILGEGELNVVGTLRALRHFGYDRNVSLEYEENPQNPLSDIELCLQAMRDAVAYLDDPEEGFVPLWDGKTFENWKINENPEAWSIEDGLIKVHGPRSHMFYDGPLAPVEDFELKVDVKAAPGANSGIYFHTQFQESGWPEAGHEAQVANTHTDPRRTGSLYGVVDVRRQVIPDDVWWTQHVIVRGRRVIIKLDGKTVVDHTFPEGEGRIGEGTFALQGHDPDSIVWFKNLRAKKL